MHVPLRRSDQVYDPLSTRKQRLFVLGAGFSAHADIPMTGSLLRQAMDLLCRENHGAFGSIDDKVRRAYRLESQPSYEQLPLAEICTLLSYHELCETRHNYNPWDRTTSTDLLALRFSIAKVIAQLTPPTTPELCKAFVRQLRPDDIVVSFNWDCLMELAMTEAGVDWQYGGIHFAVHLLKMHGSINWRRGAKVGEPKLSWQRLPMHQEEERAVFTSRDLYRDGVGWQEAVPLSLATFEVAPLIVLPGYGKAFDIRHLADLWSLPTGPASHFNVRGDVFVVGLGLARDDFIIQALFRDTLQYVENERRITIINPDPRALDNYAFLVGRPNVAFLCKRFDESDIKLMAYSAETDRWRHELEAGSPPPRPGAST